MKTSEYPHFQCSFDEFNVAQESVVPFLDKDVNIVVSFNTAVGKTALAACVFGYQLNLNRFDKVAYVSPFKAISNERYRSWSEDKQFWPKGILLSTGDDAATLTDFERSRLIILTSESLDSKTRSVQNSLWIRKLKCVVFDEAHLIGHEKRGSKAESAIMRVSQQNPDARIILLSATMSNAVDLAKWIKSLNGKETKCIQSNWRPVKIIMRYHSFDDSCDINEVNKNRIEKTLSVLKSCYPDEKVLIFVHSKRVGSMLAKSIRESGVSCAFHNASLSKSKREKIEKAFDDPGSGLNVLVSTSTLSSGVNIGG